MGACAADYDNDGRVDLYLTNFGPNVLYRNNGDGTFTRRDAGRRRRRRALEHELRVRRHRQRRPLDLFVTNYVDPEATAKLCGDSRVRAYCRPDVYKAPPSILYRNNGDGTFSDVTRSRRRLQNRRQGPGRRLRRLRRRWPVGFLRGQRSGAQLPVSQRGPRHVSRGRAARRRRGGQ